MNALGWIVRILILLILVRFVLRLLFPNRRARRPAPPRPAPERIGGELVRDPSCGTYIPKASALRLSTSGETQYFCSAKCRDAYAGAPQSSARDSTRGADRQTG